ncbi:MAG: photosynthetic complex putative assembly protein PuhB [Myxococcota bacterium]
MSHYDEMEPIYGLPAELPDGERILWQGAPRWRSLAKAAMKIHWLAVYFAVLVVIRLAVAFAGGGMSTASVELLQMIGLFLLCLGSVALFALLHARATVYTITNRRIVMRFGVVLPMAWNLPFKRLASADLVVRDDDDGDIALQLTKGERVRRIYFWPHVAPGHFFKPRPALRAIADPNEVARCLKEAVMRYAAEQSVPIAGGPGGAANDNAPSAGPRAVPDLTAETAT